MPPTFARRLRRPRPKWRSRSASELFAQLAELAHRASHCLAVGPSAAASASTRSPGACRARSSARAGAARADLNLVAGRLRRELIDQRIARLTDKLSALWQMAELVHPDRPLQRGFARVTNRRGQTLIHARDAREAVALTLQFADGAVDASVDGDSKSTAAVERKRSKSYIAPQPGLFDAPEE